MRTIKVHTPFILNINSVHQHFKAGVFEVDDVVADHWYTKSHADEVTGEEDQSEVELIEDPEYQEKDDQTFVEVKRRGRPRKES